MISANQIRAVVSSYLFSGDADKFVSCFSALSHNIHKNGDSEALVFADKVESAIADLAGGFKTKGAFIEHLRNLVRPPLSVDYYMVFQFQFGQSVNQLAVPEREIPAWVGPFGTSPAMVSASGHPVRW